jgi:hypothetical protein
MNSVKKAFLKNRKISVLFLVSVVFFSILIGEQMMKSKKPHKENQINKPNIPQSASEQLWNKTWGGTGVDAGNGIWGDGNYLYTTGETDFGPADKNLMIIKWDLNGNQIWNNTWNSSLRNRGNDIWGDGTYLYTTGYVRNNTWSDNALLIVKWDSDGNQIWNATQNNIGDDEGTRIFGIGGYIYVIGDGTEEFMLQKYDETDGKLIWAKFEGDTYNQRTETLWSNGTNIFTFGSTENSTGYSDCLLKWDMDGNVLWNKFIGDDHVFYDM